MRFCSNPENFMASLSSNPDTRRAYTRKIFLVVARVYPLVTRVLSFGRDRAWKWTLCNALPQENGGIVLDLACGTCDIAIACKKRFPAATVVGIDSSKEMLLSVDKSIPAQIHLSQQDMCDLGIRSSSVDIITGGYALRNAPDLAAALREIARVVKPSGVAAFLEFSKGTGKISAKIHTLLLWCWGSFWGLVLHGNPRIYGYIAESLDRFPDRRTLRGMFRECDFIEVASWRRIFGMVEIAVYKKSGNEK
jgi:demethylmenaquinone methyltransferase/2-methoxy-6-polyprenyl-1,4-benzoquinol methylase